jgi:hypothetical protein
VAGAWPPDRRGGGGGQSEVAAVRPTAARRRRRGEWPARVDVAKEVHASEDRRWRWLWSVAA